MAVVFFAFMWLSPKKEKIDTTSSDPSATEQTAQNSFSPLSDQELSWLRNNLAANGESSVDAEGVRCYNHSDANMNLSLKGDSLYGTVNVNGNTYALSDIIDPSSSAVDQNARREAVELLRNTSTSMGKFGKFSKFLAGQDTKVKMENDVLALELSAKSGSITRAELKKYDTEYSADESKKVKNKVVIFEGDKNSFNFQLPLPQAINTSDLYFTPRQLNDSTVLMALELAPEAYWGIEYTLPKHDSYLVKMRIVQKNMPQYIDSNNRILGFDWEQEIKRQEKGRMFEERNSRLAYKFLGGSVEELSESKNSNKERQQKLKWIAFKNQFFSSVLIADKNFNSADFSSEVLKGSVFLKSLTAEAEVNDYDWNAENPAGFNFYIGPNLYPLLNHIDKHTYEDENLKLTKLIPLGWPIFRWINTLIVIPVFNFLGSFGWNYGIVILVLTILLKLVLFPLTYKSYVSQAKMRILAPDIKEINEKYPGNDNAMVRQQKTMALYSKAGASPMSGCLPMLLQMPILFAMFTFFPNCIELRGQSFLWAHDLAAPDAIISWSGNIPLVTEYFGNHISLFCLLMTVTNILYTRISMQGQSNGMPGMKWMMYLMPLMFLVFFNNYAAGLSYYYFLSLLITIIQTYAIRKWFVKEEDVRRTMKENAKKPQKKSGFMARLEEMQKEQQRMMREQQKAQGNRKR